MDSPSPEQLIRELECQGIIVGQNFVCPKLVALSGFAGDLVGVGRVAPQTYNTEIVCA
jgi:hypothetical protein